MRGFRCRRVPTVDRSDAAACGALAEFATSVGDVMIPDDDDGSMANAC